MKSLARSQCYTIWELAGIIEYRRLGCLTLLLETVQKGHVVSGPRKAKGLKYPSLNTRAPKFRIIRVPMIYKGLVIFGALG
jgi:hypothetical protein